MTLGLHLRLVWFVGRQEQHEQGLDGVEILRMISRRQSNCTKTFTTGRRRPIETTRERQVSRSYLTLGWHLMWFGGRKERHGTINGKNVVEILWMLSAFTAGVNLMALFTTRRPNETTREERCQVTTSYLTLG